MLPIIFLSLHQISYGQFDFEPDSSDIAFPFEKFEGSDLARPNTDSIEFELRFWVNSEFGGFLQLTFNKDSTLNFRRGFPAEENNIRTVKLISGQPGFDSIWTELLANHILDLPDQDELIYTYEKDGRTIKIGPESDATEPLIHNTLDGTGYTVELFRNGEYRNYYYYNPILLSKNFPKSGWSSN